MLYILYLFRVYLKQL